MSEKRAKLEVGRGGNAPVPVLNRESMGGVFQRLEEIRTEELARMRVEVVLPCIRDRR